MWSKIAYLQKNLIWAIPASMIAGVFFGLVFETLFLKIFIIPMTFLMVYPMMVNLQINRVFSGGDTKVQAAARYVKITGIIFGKQEEKASHSCA